MSDTLAWADADAACQAAGQQLATVQSAAQNALLTTAAGGNTVWMGGTDAASEGKWMWDNNTPLSYTYWGPSEPNDAGDGEDCMEFYGEGKWNDVPCARARRYVCAVNCLQPLPPPPPPSRLPPPSLPNLVFELTESFDDEAQQRDAVEYNRAENSFVFDGSRSFVR